VRDYLIEELIHFSLSIHVWMQSKTKSESHRESVRLGQARVEEAAEPENQLCFSLDWGSKRKILLRVETDGERQRWLAALESITSCSERERSDGEDEEEEGKGEREDNCESSGYSDEEFYDADERVAPISPANDVKPGSQAWEVEEDPDYIENEDMASSISQNKSVIMHLLLEARRGLDLTRMRLPAFMLEKISTLEMFSGFLAHPDIFAAIPDHASARERMVTIVRFYLSAFHATRTGKTATKPYNPVLGETFHCFWDLPTTTTTTTTTAAPHPNSQQTQSLVESGPVPYASYNSVTLTAEQVSHHPPVSAFYAECVPKRMYVTGSIHTKIKFLGLSVGVYNTTSLKLHLLDYGEEYAMTFPNTYIRSLLTYPWMELGGRSTVSCIQTGYSANFDFHCKPFYGGRKHQVSCEISHKSEKLPFHKIEGEWNGVMYTKLSKESRDVFMDTVNTPTLRKKLLTLSAQDPRESRRQWQHVTEALARGDIDTASQAKHIVEEEQRADARLRQEQGIEWQPKYFHAEGDGWVFNSPLSTRLNQK
jgi:hypothetical protein